MVIREVLSEVRQTSTFTQNFSNNDSSRIICVVADNVDRFKAGGVIQHPVLPPRPPQEELWV